MGLLSHVCFLPSFFFFLLLSTYHANLTLIDMSFILFFLQQKRKDISTVEDPFDAPTYNIPEKPVTFAEGASYSLIILAGLGIAGAAGYAVFKELIFQPKE